jgi:hypothetical protein
MKAALLIALVVLILFNIFAFFLKSKYTVFDVTTVNGVVTYKLSLWKALLWNVAVIAVIAVVLVLMNRRQNKKSMIVEKY